MRGSKFRSEKYSKKIRGLVLPGQVDRKKATVSREVELERMVNSIVGFDIARGHYMIFAKQLNRIMKKFGGETLKSEMEILQDTWLTRGLDPTVLGRIKILLGLIPPYVPCKFDTGQFDICKMG